MSTPVNRTWTEADTAALIKLVEENTNPNIAEFIAEFAQRTGKQRTAGSFCVYLRALRNIGIINVNPDFIRKLGRQSQIDHAAKISLKRGEWRTVATKEDAKPEFVNNDWITVSEISALTGHKADNLCRFAMRRNIRHNDSAGTRQFNIDDLLLVASEYKSKIEKEFNNWVTLINVLKESKTTTRKQPIVKRVSAPINKEMLSDFLELGQKMGVFTEDEVSKRLNSK